MKKDSNISISSYHQIPKFTYEAHINKYDKNKGKIINYYLVLNQKMMLYFKDEKKDKYRGLHYLSDNYTEIFYNKKDNIFLKGNKYFYLILKIKGKEKYFISLNEFEIRKWYEIFKKTINPYRSRNLKEFYSLKESLSEGKYGLVKKAVNIKTKKEVSIKIIGRKNLIDDLKLKEVKQEIEILMHCNHNGIVKFIDYFEENNKEKNLNTIYIVMEHLSGGDLASHIVKNGPLPEKKVVSLSYNIAKSLEYLHLLGIVHRDIKPENIVLDSNNKPKIIDFGLSKIIQHNEFLIESFGTFYYASPEILSKTKYNKSTDIWSFGILIYYILTGEFPFPRNKEKALKSIIDFENEFEYDNYDFISCSLELKNLIRSCLEKDYKKRIGMSELINHPVFRKYNNNNNNLKLFD
jgi:serine/threonine protein kinase